MRRIAEGFELPADWGFFTNVGMTLDTADPLTGNGSAKYDAANIEYATCRLLPNWGSFYTWTGLHVLQANPASITTNWIFGWRSEATPGSVIEGGAIGVRNSRFVLSLGHPTPTIVATGLKILASNTLYQIQVELLHGVGLGWVKLKINNRVIPDLTFSGPTAIAGEQFLSGVWIGSLFGGGNGNCWVDDFVMNDQQQFQRSDYGYPGMLIIQSVESNGEGSYGEWTDIDGQQHTSSAALTAIEPGEETGVTGTPIVATNGKTATVPCIISVDGPITSPTFENETTGDAISFSATVPAGSQLIVDTMAHTALLMSPHPTLPGVTIETNWQPFITGTPMWFRLEPGANDINVTPAGASAVVVSWVSWDAGPIDSFTFDPKPAAPTPPTGVAGLSSVDHVYRCSMDVEGKIIPGIRRGGVDTWHSQQDGLDLSPHLFPDSILAALIDRMRQDPSTGTPWTPANIDSTEAIFKFSNYLLADK